MMITGEQISALMSKKGPVVKCVMLRANGTVDEVSVDMTPKDNPLVKLFGGQPSIVGQFSVLETVVMKKLEPDEGTDEKNKHRLPHPLHEEDHLGDLLLIRMNQESEPESFTKSEWAKFLEDAPFTPEAYEEWKAKHGVNDEDEEEDEDDEMEIDAFLDLFRKNFKDQNGREPTDEEVAEVKADLVAAQDEEDEEDEGEDIEGLTEEEQAVLDKTIRQLEKKLKRDPSDEEIAAALLKVEGGDVILAKVNAIEEAEAEEEEDEDDDEEGLELDEAETELLEIVLDSLSKKLKRPANRQEIIEELKKRKGGKELASKLEEMAMLGGDDDDDDEDEDEKDDEEDPLNEDERAIMEKIVVELTKKLKRAPEDEEVMQVLIKMPRGEAILGKLMAEGEDDDDEDEDEDEEEDDDEEAARPSVQVNKRPQQQQQQRRPGGGKPQQQQGRRPNQPPQQKKQRRG